MTRRVADGQVLLAVSERETDEPELELRAVTAARLDRAGVADLRDALDEFLDRGRL